MYGYDLFGWYVGEVDSSFRRKTDTEPTNKDLSAKPGDIRSNWTGYEWIEMPYRYQEYNPTRTSGEISIMQFILMFTAAERVAIYALRDTDPIVAGWLGILEDARLMTVDLKSSSVDEALSYLVGKEVITAQRKAQIQNGETI